MWRRAEGVDERSVTAAAVGASWGWSLPGGRPLSGGSARRPRAAQEASAGGASLAAGLRVLTQPVVAAVLLLLVLAVLVAARGAITRAIGTAGTTPAPVSIAASPLTPAAGGTQQSPGAERGATANGAPEAVRVRLHPARNPFAARVGVSGALLSFVSPPAGWTSNAHEIGRA